jgi:hypothetical protein
MIDYVALQNNKWMTSHKGANKNDKNPLNIRNKCCMPSKYFKSKEI